MLKQIRIAAVLVLAMALAARAADAPAGNSAPVYNVRDFGAAGDGKALDTPAINKAIDEASSKGGGTVYFPAGDYLSVSIRLKSNISLYIDQGATIVAAKPEPDKGIAYDEAENNDFDAFQDFGHSHWHNSLIWGENLENVSILGPGMIWGKGLVRSGSQSRTKEQNDAIKNAGGRPRANNEIEAEGPTSQSAAPDPAGMHPRGPFGYPSKGDALEPGWGNKAIALKLCRNVILKDFSIKHGGHFAILATGVDNFTLDNLKLDTNRDGMDIDCCRNVRVSNCSVNSPFDDGICPKSTYALGYARATENVTITNCQVSGFDEGTFLDGTYKREYTKYPHNSGSTGRIKFGTESNGGFKNITISNCVFSYCRGLALETVDGGLLEDVSINNITMRDVNNSPIFLRLGSRLRGPKGTEVGTLRRINISNVVVYNAAPAYGCVISGIPDHDIEDVTIRDVKIYYRGGGTEKQATTKTAEKEKDYPEPSMFGDMPSYGFFIRHVKGIELSNIDLRLMSDDVRAPFVLQDVKDAVFHRVKAQRTGNAPAMVLKNVEALSIEQCPGLPDAKKDKVEDEKLTSSD